MELEELYGKFYKEILAYCAAMTKSAAAAESWSGRSPPANSGWRSWIC